VLEYRIDEACRKVGFLAKTTVSLHRCAVITIVFSDPISDFAKFVPPKELVHQLTVNFLLLALSVLKMSVLVD
jgi:hypothetical protein